jgi:hypothetical protein
MSKAFWIGLILLVAGLVVALRGASIKEDKGGVNIGDAKIHVVEHHAVPTWIGWTAAGVGLILVVTGLRGRSGSSVVRDQTPHTTP